MDVAAIIRFFRDVVGLDFEIPEIEAELINGDDVLPGIVLQGSC